jgi:hypothetical protein
MVRRDALARLAAGGKGRLAAPKAPQVASVGAAGVTLRWTAPNGSRPHVYQVLRDGRVLGRTTHRAFTDTTVKPGKTYRYAVRGLDKKGRRGLMSAAVRVEVPKVSTQPPAGPPGVPPASDGATPNIAPIQQGSGPGPDPTPTATPTATPTPDPLTAAMVDRLFWRAGFGPSQAHRDAWVGRGHAELVDWLLDTPLTLLPTTTPPLAGGGTPIDPLASDDADRKRVV